ncbi:MAG: tRNA pseudouridine(38-40) synthase TruA [Rickettsiales bacterium]|nr:tRNA pseudouridine(38-40) synthase TruA [Rickettsiales bacterium]OUV78783.1 MAG: tRNA pseudouridine(38-40) synthase TruA [Rickettsiales bacterium TMED131]|tara:strand:- start:1434 stop:2186 length:753 start_codon:yes stop_codon:yes gene_type:complete
MTRFKLTIEYDGANFIGWQKQKKGHSIQETIEKAAKKLLQENVSLVVAGRTDTGVHAENQIAHLDISKNLNLKNILLGLNFYISKEKHGTCISIKRVSRVSGEFNARFSAKKKVYNYKIFNKEYRSPINSKNTWWVTKKLDVLNMKKAASFLEGRHDFSSFRASGCQASSPIRTMEKVFIKKNKNIITIQFTARSFLYNQVRIMAGTLKDVGTGLLTPETFRKILKNKKRSLAGITAPAKGLTLKKVSYT